MEQPVLGVDAVEVVGHLAAQEAGGDRVVGVAGDRDRAAVRVDGHEHRAGVGAVVRAGAAHDAEQPACWAPSYSAWRPRSARPSVISSAYSRSEPTGSPLASRVTTRSGERWRRASAR